MTKTHIYALVLLSFLGALQANSQSITLNNLAGRDARILQGSSWGVPFAKGEVRTGSTFTLNDPSGQSHELESWPLAFWPDGSLKWVGFSTVSSRGLDKLELSVTAPTKGKAKTLPALVGMAKESSEGIAVDAGVLRCFFPSSGDAMIQGLELDGKILASEAKLVAVLERREEGQESGSKERFESKIERLSLLQNTPMRVVVKIEGKHKGLTSGREWLPFALYCTIYKGVPTISITHSFNFDSDGREDFIAGLGLRFDVPLRDEEHNRHVRFSGSGDSGSGFWCQPVRLAPGYRPSAGKVFTDNYADYLKGAPLPSLAELSQHEREALLTCPVWGDMRLVQNGPNGFSIDKRTSPESSWVHVTDGTRSLGGALLGDSKGSIFVGVKDFWQSYPAALYVDNADKATASLTAWLWSPDAEAMDMRHYDTKPHDLKINYEDYKEGWESPYGVGHRSTIEVRLFSEIPSNEELLEVAKAVQKPVQYTCAPEYYYSVGAFGDYWGLPVKGNSTFESIETELNRTLDFYKRQVEQRYWYGFWNYGDVMHNYDFTRHDWRYDIGGWAWNNIELAPNVLLWTCFLRTGREDLWTMAEAMEKHSSEVDVHHIGRFAPLGSRHNVKHWGDGCKQPRIEYAAMKRFMYYLTGGDALTGDLMTEQIGSEKAYEYARRISTWGAVSGTYLKSSLNDWAYYAGNWMLEWERTGNTLYRDKLLGSMRDIVALGKMSGRLAFDYFDPESGHFMVYLKEDPDYKGFVDAPKSDFVPASSLSQKKIREIVGYRLANVRGDTFSTLFGAPEFMSDFRATVDYPEFWTMVDNSFADNTGASGNSMTNARMAAWVAASRSDAQMGKLAWKNLLDNGTVEVESDGTAIQSHNGLTSTPNIVNAVEEPEFLGQSAAWQRHTPATTQWLLNAIEVMQWAKAYAPTPKN